VSVSSILDHSAEFVSSEKYSSVRLSAGLHQSTARQKNSSAASPIRASQDYYDLNVRHRELGNQSFAAGALSRCDTHRSAPLPLRTSSFAVAARTKTAYRHEASKCSVLLECFETIEPMLIRDIAVDSLLRVLLGASLNRKSVRPASSVGNHDWKKVVWHR
jgi:hypothetical protein